MHFSLLLILGTALYILQDDTSAKIWGMTMQQPDFTTRVSYGKKIKGQAELQLRMRFSISLQHFIKMLILMPPSFKIIHKVKVCAPSTLRSVVRPKNQIKHWFLVWPKNILCIYIQIHRVPYFLVSRRKGIATQSMC